MKEATTTHSTLLAAIWAADDESAVIADLADGSLKLTGNFKGHEAEVAADAAAA